MEAKAKSLEPQLVRIFYNDNWEERQTRRRRRTSPPSTGQSSSPRTAVRRSTSPTSAVNVAKLSPLPSMKRFADVLEDLVEEQRLHERALGHGRRTSRTRLSLTLAEYDALYRALHEELVARGLRDHIKIMGGDLVESRAAAGSNHRIWFAYMAANMNDIVDAYSVHIYWRYFDIERMEFRLKDVHQVVTEEIPVGGTEADVHHGVRRPWSGSVSGQADSALRVLRGRYGDAEDEPRRRSSSSGSSSPRRSSATPVRRSGTPTGGCTTSAARTTSRTG